VTRVTRVRRPDADDETAFLLRSIEDLDREHAAGDISDGDYSALRDEYTSRAALLLTAEAELAPESGRGNGPAPRTRPRRHRRRGLLVGGVTALVCAAVAVAVFSITRPRAPGQTVTGSASQAKAQEVREDLAQAESFDAAGDVITAMELYGTVLQLEPNQPEALAESGWIEFESGVRDHKTSVVAAGQQAEERAAAVAPGAWAPRLYLGSMDLTEKDPTAAAAQFRRFIAAHPPAAQLAAAKPVMIKAFAAAHEPLPPGV
jgi:hypothetical protein